MLERDDQLVGKLIDRYSAYVGRFGHARLHGGQEEITDWSEGECPGLIHQNGHKMLDTEGVGANH